MFEKQVIKIAIVDNNKILREALRHILNKAADMEVLDEADDGFGAIDIARKGDVDLIILEPIIPKKEGIDITRDIVAINQTVSVLILTLDETPNNAFRMLKAGAMGWISKTTDSATLLKAIRQVSQKRVYLPKDLQSVFAERYLGKNHINQPEEKLSDREFQVMRLLAQGHTNREIAKMLFIGTKTVDTHRANLLRKLGLRNNSDITRFAIQHGFIKI